jgi:UDP-N-acetylmuramoyl-tripeptide--D-alanyl-D-alanine ligase
LKAIHLENIIKAIDGKLIKGDRDIIIKDVVRYNHNIRSNFLHIDIYNQRISDDKLFCKYSNVAVVTDKVDKFINMKGKFAIIEVKNIKDAYWKFVEYYRSLFNIPVVAITGTCGKTTTKEMIKHILSKRYNVTGTVGNYNTRPRNFIYLLNINDKADAAVFETAVVSPGDVSDGCRHFKPTIRILLNIGVYHLLKCKTPEGYIKAKAEIMEGISSEDLLILNADDENIKTIDISKAKKIVYFGVNNKADFKAIDVIADSEGLNYSVSHKDKICKGRLNMLGAHNVYNALAAIAAVNSLGIDVEEACELLQSYKAVRRHLQLRKAKNGALILDDSWNNTPPSMTQALKVLKEIGNGRKKILVCDYMYNMGTSKYAKKQYANLGSKVVEAGVDILIMLGYKAKEIANKAIESGMDKNNVYFVKSKREVYRLINLHLSEDSIVLLKTAETIIRL